MHTELRLVIDENVCAIEAASQTQRNPQVLTIDRNSFDISLVSRSLSTIPSQMIFGILGAIRLHAGLYLIVITKAKKVGQIQGHDIYQVQATAVHNLGRDKGLSAAELEDDKSYVAMLKSVLDLEFFYFSYTYDLTRWAQSAFNLDAQTRQLPIWRRCDQRFFWNRYLQKDFIAKAAEYPEFNEFILPVTIGFFSINQCRIQERTFDYILITRRSCKRAGTRYNTRGVDIEGNVANFNETEQVVIDHESKTLISYLQTRGSIPLFWSQQINVKYQPPMVVEKIAASQQAFEEHFKEQTALYGSQVLVNLVNTHGYENQVNKAFGEIIDVVNHKQIKYVPFDFHKECKGMRFDRISNLVDKISGDLDAQGYFSVDLTTGKILSTQKSVVRTNCMDCLDRTNVVQSVLARRALRIQLINQKIISNSPTLEQFKDFDFMLKNVWADNADAVSIVYSGTGALKTDYTRTGKRTIMGQVQDGVNSAVRYIKNNFLDGYRQDAFDLFLGNYRVRPGSPSPFVLVENSDNSIRRKLIPGLLILAVFMLLASIAIPAGSFRLKLFYLLFWAVIIFFCYRTILKNAADFVDSPRLFNPITGKILPASLKEN